MYKHKPIGRTFLFGVALYVLVIGAAPTAVSAETETEILNITVGELTNLSSKVYQNMSTVMVSRTGVAGVIYRKPGRETRYPKHTLRGSAMGYRVSTDRGATWGKEMIAPDAFGGGQNSGTLTDGGVIIPATDPKPSTAHTRAEGWKGGADLNPAATRETGWYNVRFLRFPDDMMIWQAETSEIYLPNAGPPSLDVKHPGMGKGKMVQLPNGDMLAPMYGGFKGDRQDIHRAIIVRSKNQGRTWKYYASIAYEPVDPHPELPGQYCCAAEPSITLLPNGKMVAMLRAQLSHFPGEYKSMAVCWSDDLGKTWTKSETTKPHLMNISPTLAALDNGVVACQYGRPGFHVVFSLDDGHTWQDRISFSDLTGDHITGQFDMIKVGANKLVTVGSDAEGTKIWPIWVERLKVSPARVALQGRVLDQQGNPVTGATVERGPNRYALDSWLEHETRLGVSKAGPLTVGSPKLSYLSIRKPNGYPTVQTDPQGRFGFESVKLGEYVLTVEADGYAPQLRHVKVQPKPQPQEFRLKVGRKVCNRVVDEKGKPVAGACVVLNRWHIHTDRLGFFHWSVETPIPEQVEVSVYRRFSFQYGSLKKTLPLSQIESQPIILPPEGQDGVSGMHLR